MLQRNDRKYIQDVVNKNMSHDVVCGCHSMLSGPCTVCMVPEVVAVMAAHSVNGPTATELHT